MELSINSDPSFFIGHKMGPMGQEWKLWTKISLNLAFGILVLATADVL